MVYRLYRVRDIIRIPPSEFDKPLEEAAYNVLRRQYEGVISSKVGVIVAILDLKINPEGTILMGDGAVYFEVEYTILAFNPFQKEVVEGEVVTIIPQGLFVNLGAQDGFIHLSQISDEKVEYDPTRPGFVLKDSKRIVEKGDVVRARIYTLAASSDKGFRIHLTMRQPYMGKVDWYKKK